MLKQQEQTLPAQQTKNVQPKRISLPKEHSIKVKPLLQIEQKNMQFSTYRKGDKCFKKISIGAGVMPKNELPDSYLTGVSLCDKTKITQAYDTAMGKWLNKK